jgi:hypothetical protein
MVQTMLNHPSHVIVQPVTLQGFDEGLPFVP